MFKHLVRAAISSIFFIAFFCCAGFFGKVDAQTTCEPPKFFTTGTDRGNAEKTLTGYTTSIESLPDFTDVYVAYPVPDSFVVDTPLLYLCRSDQNTFATCENDAGQFSGFAYGIGYDSDGSKYFFKRFGTQDFRMRNYTQINFSQDNNLSNICSVVVQKNVKPVTEPATGIDKCDSIGYTAKYNYQNDANKILVTFFAKGNFAKGSSSKLSDYHIVLGQSGMNAPRFSYPMEWVTEASSTELGTSFIIDKNSVRGIEGAFFWDAPPAISIGLKQGSQTSTYCADLKNGGCTIPQCFDELTPDSTDKWQGESPTDVSGAAANAKSTSPDVPFDMCSQVVVPLESSPDYKRKSDIRNNCCECITGVAGSTYGKGKDGFGECSGKGTGAENVQAGLYTAVGCIPASGEGIIASLVRLGLGIAGGVALLMILAAGFMLTTSQGEPKKAGEAKELITSAVMGLLFIIFSVTILQFIGVTILQIPGFGK